MPAGRQPDRGAVRALGAAWALGWPIAAGVLVGYWIDETAGTAPWATLVLAVGALAAGVRRMLRLLAPEDPS